MADEQTQTGGVAPQANGPRSFEPQANMSRPIVYQRRPTPNLMSDIKLPAQKPVAPTPTAPTPLSLPALAIVQTFNRQRLTTQTDKPPKNKQFLKYNKLGLTLSTMAVLAFVTGLGIGLANLWSNNKVNNRVTASTSRPDNNPNVPNEGRPSDNDLANYSVAADMPRLLTIPKIGVEARVKQVGVKADNTLMAPDNIYDTGWYTGSAKPGQTGAAVIDGHVHGPTQPGIFADLKKLTVGDKIQIEKGDHTLINYVVAKTKVYDVSNVDMAAVMSTSSPGRNALNLITCTGSINYDTNSYNQRLVVFALQQP